MADASDAEKTEEPTSKRKSDARSEGNVPQSAEVSNAITILAIVLIFKMAGGFFLKEFTAYFVDSMRQINEPVSILGMQKLVNQHFHYYIVLVAPFAFTMLALGIFSHFIQVGWLFTTKPLQPKPDVLWKAFNPESYKQFFNMQAVQNLVKALAKIAVLSLITYFTLKKDFLNFMNYIDMSVMDIFLHISHVTIKLLLNIFYLYVLLAIGDFMFTKHQHHTKLKMSKQEVKDEYKQLEGDPQVKQKIRTIMMEESLKRMIKKVPESDVVITNPIHLAVALGYKPEQSEAPIVLAKGKRKIAERIKEIARQNNIPIVEDKPLARMLYKHCKVGKEISIDFYSAVAEILAYVYKLKGKK